MIFSGVYDQCFQFRSFKGWVQTQALPLRICGCAGCPSAAFRANAAEMGVVLHGVFVVRGV